MALFSVLIYFAKGWDNLHPFLNLRVNATSSGELCLIVPFLLCSVFRLFSGLQARFSRSRCWDGDWCAICLLGINSRERWGKGAWWPKEGTKLQCRHEKASAHLAGCCGMSIAHWNCHIWAEMAQPPFLLLVPSLVTAIHLIGVVLDKAALSSWGTAWRHSWSVDGCLLTTCPTASQYTPRWKRIWAAYLHADRTLWMMSLYHRAPSSLLFIVDSFTSCRFHEQTQSVFLSCSPLCAQYTVQAWRAVALNKYLLNTWIWRLYFLNIFPPDVCQKKVFTFQLSHLSWFRVIWLF